MNELRRQLRNNRIDETGKLDAEGWLETVQWATHLAGFEPETIRRYGRLPDPEKEEVLALMCESFERIIARATDTTQEASRWIRKIIARKEKNVQPRRPFNAAMGPDTKIRYSRVINGETADDVGGIYRRG